MRACVMSCVSSTLPLLDTDDYRRPLLPSDRRRRLLDGLVITSKRRRMHTYMHAWHACMQDRHHVARSS
jgi:hypothetical protein